MRPLAVFALYLLGTSCAAPVTLDAAIYSITPNNVGMLGGGVVTISGKGFERAGVEGQTTVFLGNRVCTPIEYFSTDTQIVCKTPAFSTQDNLPVAVSLVSFTSAVFGRCDGGCPFVYPRWDFTPSIRWAPLGVFSGQRITLGGFLRGLAGGHFSVFVDGLRCQLGPDSDTVLALNPWEYRGLECTLPALPAGRRNVTLVANQPGYANGAGQATFGTLRAVNNTIFMFTVVPRVTGLSTQATGTLGQQLLRITGSGFQASDDADDCSANEVALSGLAAEVVACDGASLTVRVPPNTDGLAAFSAPQGSFGLLGRVWLNQQVGSSGPQVYATVVGKVSPSFTFAQINGTVGYWTGVPAGSAWNSFDEWYFQTAEAFFIAPFTTNYTFYLRCDDWALLELSPNASWTALKSRSQCNGAWYNYYTSPVQVSEKVSLVAGERYAFRLSHREFGGGDFVTAAVRIHNEPTSGWAEQYYQSLRERQTVVFNTVFVREVQLVVLSGFASGLFRLTGAKGTSGTVDLLATDLSAFNSALTASLTACGQFSTVRTANATAGTVSYRVTFNCPTAAPFPRISVQNSALIVKAGAAPTIVVTRVVAASNPLSGAFRLGFDDQWTAPLLITANEGAIRAALISLNNFTDVTILRAGNAQDSLSITLLFQEDLGAKPTFFVDAALVGGDNLTAKFVVQERWNGDGFYDPIPSAWFQQPTQGPQVHVTVNGVAAACVEPSTQNAAPCRFAYNDTLTPTITNLTVAVPATVGDTLVLSGLNFPASDVVSAGTNFPAITVTVAGAACDVTSASVTDIVCTLAHTVVGSHIPVVIFASVGRAELDPDMVPAIDYGLVVDAITPDASAGSVAGGAVLSLTGTGFSLDSAENNIHIDGIPCVVTLASHERVQCIVPPTSFYGALASLVHPLTPSSHVAEIFLAVNGLLPTALGQPTPPSGGFHTTPFAEAPTSDDVTSTMAPFVGALVGVYTYTWDLTPVVTAVSPAEWSAGISTRITLTGNFFLAAALVSGGETQATVTVGGHACWALTVSAVEISCVLLRATPAANLAAQLQNAIVVHVSVTGEAGELVEGPFLAHVDAGVTAAAVLFVDGQSTTAAGTAGGTVLTLTGRGFHHNIERMAVSLPGSVPCYVTESNFTHVTCVADTTDDKINVSGSLNVTVNDVLAACAPGQCVLTFQAALTPVLTAVSPAVGLAVGGGSLTLTVTGQRFAADTRVFLGALLCPLVAFYNDTTVTCQAPALAAGVYPVRLNVPDVGDAWSDGVVSFTSVLSFTSLVARNGSMAGGLVVTITGAGFASLNNSQNNVTFAGRPAHVVAVTSTTLTVVAPAAVNPTQSGIVVASVRIVVRADALTPNLPHLQAALAAELAVRPSRLGVGIDSAQCAGGICAFTYNSAVTPRVTNVVPEQGWSDTIITITGSGFVVGGTTVRVANVPCPLVGNMTTTLLTCQAGSVPAGRHPVIVAVPTNGGVAAQATNKRFRSLLEVTSVVPVNVDSYGGGAVVTVVGRGFGVGMASSIVSACNVSCAVLTSTYTRLTCVTGATNTPTALAAFVHVPVQILTGAFNTSSNLNIAIRAFDGDFLSYFDAAGNDRSTCTIGLDLGAINRAVLTEIRFFPRFRDRLLVVGGKFQVSVDGASWSTVATVRLPIHEGWTSVSVVYATPVRFIRYAGPLNSGCRVTELEFSGQPVVAPVASNAAGDVCNVSVIAVAPPSDASLGPVVSGVFGAPSSNTANLLSLASVASAAQLIFSVATTPVVTQVVPRFGSSLGGTRLTITGRGLADTVDSILINNVPCALLSASDMSVECETGARLELEPASVFLTTASHGIAVVPTATKLFRYLDRWSLPNTWLNDEMPLSGDSVVIPADQTVLMDLSPPRLFLLLVQGMLVFDRQDLALNATYILILGGHMEVGTEDEPFLQQATITLHGDRMATVEVPHLGAKVLGVQNSVTSQASLDLHGRPRRRVWTKVGATAQAGATTIVTAEPTDFAAGDKILITSSEQSFEQAEELTVVGRSADNITLLVTPALKHTHHSEFYQAPNGRVVDMRCEVGLLSRNVVVQGDESSEAQRFGVHTISEDGALYRVENIEVRRCGQAGILGRYCTHMHMGGDMRHSYVKSNSIHNSFQRSTTIHGSHNTLVQNNFAYHVMGHTFFVEDGGEANTLFDANLGAVTLRSFVMLESDIKPATFWMSSPRNLWRNNVAAGCQNDGFWFEPPGNPNGPSFTTTICPVHEHILEFRNNTAHSNGVHGLRIYPTYLPLEDPCNTSSPSLPQYLHDFTSFHNSGHGIFHKRVGDVHHVNASLVENGSDEFNWIFLRSADYHASVPELANLQDVLFVASRTGVLPPNSAKRAAFLPQNEFFYVAGAVFVNYGEAGALSGCNECQSQTELVQGAYTYRFEGLEFFNSPRRTRWTGPFKDIFRDLDGSLTGLVGGTALPFWAFNMHPACTRPAGMVLDGGVACDSSVRVRRVQIDGINPRELDFMALNVTSNFGTSLVPFLPKEFYGYAVPMVAAANYTLRIRSLVDVQSMRLRYSEPEYIDTDTEFVILQFPYIDYRYAFKVTYATSKVEVGAVSALQELTGSNDYGTGQIHYDTKQWNVVLSPHGVDLSLLSTERGPYDAVVKALQCAPGSCGVPGWVPLGPPRMWSLAASWTSNALPSDAGPLVIPAGVYMVLDLPAGSMPRFSTCVVYGRLEFLDTADRTLVCDTLLVWGELAVGSPGSAFTHLGRIVLRGNRFSPVLIASDSVFLGNKVMAVYGDIFMRGEVPLPAWTRLAATASVGAATVTLAEPVSWQAGDTITITPTEYGASELETKVIASVSPDQLTLTLTSALAFRHFAGDVDDGRGGVLTLAAAVAVLSRNVVVEGELASVEDTYGAHVVVGDVDFGADNGVRTGRSQFIGVEFLHCGAQGTEHPSVFYNYQQPQSLASAPVNLLDSCAFSLSFNYGVVSFGAVGLTLLDNVFHRTFRTAVDLDAGSFGAVVAGNLVAGNYRSPDDATADWVRPFAGFYLNVQPATLRANVVGGGEDSGFVFRALACGTASDALDFGLGLGEVGLAAGPRYAPGVGNNEAHAVLVGAMLLADAAGGARDCVELVDFVAWKCAHIGLLTVDQTSNVDLVRVAVADNHIGISLNFFRDGASNVARVIDSFVFGSTAATDAASCAKSLTCLAYGENDFLATACNSVFGNAYRRVGVVLPQYLNRAKTCDLDGGLQVCRPPSTPERLCSLPWEKRYGLPITVRAQVQFSGVTFGYFAAADCARSTMALAVNPSQYEFTPEMLFADIVWHAVAPSARMWFGITALTNPQCQVGCDALNYVRGTDTDGSVLGGVGGTFVSSTNAPLADPVKCKFNGNTSTFDCVNYNIIGATLDNIDRDRGGRRIGPVLVTRYSITENRTWFSTGPDNDGCAKRFFFGQYPFALEANNTYFVRTLGSMPNNARLRFLSYNPADSVVIKLFYTASLVMDVFNGDVLVPISNTAPSLTSAAGANAFDPQARVLILTMRGGSNVAKQTYTLRVKNVVALTISVRMSLDDFEDATGRAVVANLALLLSIPVSRIRVVAVHQQGQLDRRDADVADVAGAGDVEDALRRATTNITDIRIEIVDSSNSSVNNDTAVEEQLARFDAVLDTLKLVASNGALLNSFTASGLSVAGLAVVPPASWGANSAAFVVPVSSGSSGNGGSGGSGGINTVWLINGLVIAGCVLLLGGVVLFVAMRHRRAVSPRRKSTKAALARPSPALMQTTEFVEPAAPVTPVLDLDENEEAPAPVSVRGSLVLAPAERRLTHV